MKEIVYVLSEGSVARPVSVEQYFFVKIGHTKAPSAESRLKQCQTGNPRNLKVLREFPGSVEQEKKLHKILSAYRQAGEWFRLPGFLINQVVDREAVSAEDLVDRLSKLGCVERGGLPEELDQGQKHRHAVEVLQAVNQQHELADQLLFEMRQLGEIGEVNQWFLIDALCGTGLKLAPEPEGSFYVLEMLREAA